MMKAQEKSYYYINSQAEVTKIKTAFTNGIMSSKVMYR